MKILKAGFILIASLVITGCGTPYGSTSDFSVLDGDFLDDDFFTLAEPSFSSLDGKALCNKFSLTDGTRTYMSGYVQHPTDEFGDANWNHLMLKVTSLDSSFLNGLDLSTYIAFYRATSTPSRIIYDEQPIDLSIVAPNYVRSQALFPSVVRNHGVAPPFFILLENVGFNLNQIAGVVVTPGQNQPGVAHFLMPRFIADPTAFQKDSKTTTQMLQIHPFVNRLGLSGNFVNDADSFCFMQQNAI